MNAPIPRPLAYYRNVGQEELIFEHARQKRLPILLKGPTGCGKSRFVQAMAERLGQPLYTVACNDETSASDLLGRWLIRGGDTIWQDGPVTRAVRGGGILYLDEVAEAREDIVVVLHSLADHRRELFLDRHDEVLRAPADFMLVVSYNPGYRRGLKDLKPSTRQRFVAIALNYPAAEIEAEILRAETGLEKSLADKLVRIAGKIRAVEELGGGETASTRLLVDAAHLIQAGLPPRLAVQAGIVQPLTDDPSAAQALQDMADLVL
ncbi:MAG: CbbQ/NirQ/NorQ/GpvN family protein [Myxococcota bacterium]